MFTLIKNCDRGNDLIDGFKALPSVDICMDTCDNTAGCIGFALLVDSNLCYLKDDRCEDTPHNSLDGNTYLKKGNLLLKHVIHL